MAVSTLVGVVVTMTLGRQLQRAVILLNAVNTIALALVVSYSCWQLKVRDRLFICLRRQRSNDPSAESIANQLNALVCKTPQETLNS